MIKFANNNYNSIKKLKHQTFKSKQLGDNSSESQQKYVDPLQKFPLKAFSYSNEVGAAIREVAPKLGTFLWAPVLMYYGADIYDKYKNDCESYAPSGMRATKQALFQGLSGMLLPAGAVYLGQNAVGLFPSDKLFKNSLTINQKNKAFDTILDFIEQEKFSKNSSAINAYKSKLEQYTLNHIIDLKDEKNSLSPIKRLFSKFSGKYALCKVDLNNLNDFMGKNLEDMCYIRSDLLNDKKNPLLSKRLYKKFYNQIPTLKRIYGDEARTISAKMIMKDFANGRLFKHKLLKTLGGFVSLGLLVKPINNFVRNVVFNKFIDPGLEKMHNLEFVRSKFETMKQELQNTNSPNVVSTNKYAAKNQSFYSTEEDKKESHQSKLVDSENKSEIDCEQ